MFIVQNFERHWKLNNARTHAIKHGMTKAGPAMTQVFVTFLDTFAARTIITISRTISIIREPVLCIT